MIVSSLSYLFLLKDMLPQGWRLKELRSAAAAGGIAASSDVVPDASGWLPVEPRGFVSLTDLLSGWPRSGREGGGRLEPHWTTTTSTTSSFSALDVVEMKRGAKCGGASCSRRHKTCIWKLELQLSTTATGYCSLRRCKEHARARAAEELFLDARVAEELL